MKASILFSNTIRKILTVFVTNPGERFYLRQLCKLTLTSPRPIQLALKKLHNAGILVVEKEANINFFTLNKQSPIYSEIKGIILKTEAVGDALRKALKGLGNLECAFIYGSVAKDIERRGSDIDVCLIGEINLNELNRITSQLEAKLKREVSCVTFSPEEWFESIQKKKSFVMNILNNKKIMLFGSIDEL